MQMRKHAIKIILSAFMFLLLILPIQEVKVHAETKEEISSILELVGITRDSDDNKLAESKYITRGEFAQLLIKASAYSEEVNNTYSSKLFKDVLKSNTTAPYIQLAVTKGYMTGYLNGLFKPDQAITLKEAVYATLGLLGYTKEDFTGKLSNARYETFQELGMNKNLSITIADKLTVNDCETLFYNLLNTKQKGGDIYCKSLGYSVNENNVIDYEAVLKAKTKGPIIAKTGWEKQLKSKLSTYTIFQNEEIITSKEITENSIIYYSERLAQIWVYDEKVIGVIDNITYNQGNPQDFTVAGTTYTVENPKDLKKLVKNNDIQKDTRVALLLGKDDKVAYLYPIKSTLAEDNWQKKLSFDVKQGTVTMNQRVGSYRDIKSNDLVYYCDGLQQLWVFNQKVYGILDGIVLNQGEPQELTIAGVSYAVESSKTMKTEIKAAGIKAGIPVAILLGWDDKVSKILKLSSKVADGNWQVGIGFDTIKGTIYKDGSIITPENVLTNDVLYYSKELKTIWVYDKKVYGVLDSISPSLTSPEAITVGGKTYELKLQPVDSSNTSVSGSEDLVENAWGTRLRDHEISEGDNVVILFGCNGKVADIYTTKLMPVTFSGYVLSTENKVIKDDNGSSAVQKIIRIIDTDGIIREIPCSDSSIAKGSIVEISFKEGNAVITKATSQAVPTDIEKKQIAKDAGIIEVNGQNYHKLSVGQMSEIVWNSANVLYCKLNASNEITDLIVISMTDSFYQFGFLNKVVYANYEEGIYTNQLTFDLNGSESTIALDVIKWDINLGPKAIRMEDGKITDMQNMEQVSIAYLNAKQANTGSGVARIADDVLVYYYKNGEYYKGTFDSITGNDGQRLLGYKLAQGPIRIILVMN